jgi:hypothetical protein
MTAHEACIVKIARPSGAGNTVCTVSNTSTVLWHTSPRQTRERVLTSDVYLTRSTVFR